jgi:hypothetical protein
MLRSSSSASLSICCACCRTAGALLHLAGDDHAWIARLSFLAGFSCSCEPCLLGCRAGYAALNKVLGRAVYSSHMQLGGPRVMGVNGISHHLVQVRVAGSWRPGAVHACAVL